MSISRRSIFEILVLPFKGFHVKLFKQYKRSDPKPLFSFYFVELNEDLTVRSVGIGALLGGGQNYNIFFTIGHKVNVIAHTASDSR